MHMYSHKMEKQPNNRAILCNENGKLSVYFGRIDEVTYVSRIA